MKKAYSLFLLCIIIACSLIFVACGNDNNRINELELEKEELRQQITELEEENEELNKQITELEKDNEELNKQITESENSNLSTFFTIENARRINNSILYTVHKHKEKNIVGVRILCYKYLNDTFYTVEHDMTNLSQKDYSWAIPSEFETFKVEVIYIK